jgi:hypothetical protein
MGKRQSHEAGIAEVTGYSRDGVANMLDDSYRNLAGWRLLCLIEDAVSARAPLVSAAAYFSLESSSV